MAFSYGRGIKKGHVRGVVKGLRGNFQQTLKGMKKGLQECGELLLRESRKIVPIDTKALYKSSRTVQLGGRGLTTVQQIVEYRMPYALIQHENLLYKHKPGKSAKYLSIPAEMNKQKMVDIIYRRSVKK